MGLGSRIDGGIVGGGRWPGRRTSNFADLVSCPISPIVSNAPFDYKSNAVGGVLNHFHATGSFLDLPAVLIVAAVTVILVLGIKQSAGFNTAMVILKLAVVAFVIGVGAFYVNPANWHPFWPHGAWGVSLFGRTVLGWTNGNGEPVGMLAGAAIMFFAYIGFDSVSTHAEEARNPKRDVPIGIVVSLALCTVLYIAVAAVLTGMVRYDQLNIEAPVAQAFAQIGLRWAQGLISAGAIAGITSVLLVLMLSQPRVLLAMARDGFLPRGFFGAVHPRFRTPWKLTIITGFVVATLAALLPLDILAQLVNIGTLLAFVIVCLAVLVMRKTHPDAQRPFRCPAVSLVSILGIAFCLLLMFSLPWENWLRLAIWLVVGLVIYFAYGRKHSVLARLRAEEEEKQLAEAPTGRGVQARWISGCGYPVIQPIIWRDGFSGLE